MSRPVNPNVPEDGFKSKKDFLDKATIADQDLTIAKAANESNGIEFDASALSGNNKMVTIAASDTAGPITINLPNTSGTLSYSAGGANTALSNLASVAIATDLDPSVDNTQHLGGTNKWNSINVTSVEAYGGVTLRDASSNPEISLAIDPQGLNVPIVRGPNRLTGYYSFGLLSRTDNTADAQPTADAFVRTGNKNAGTGNTGNVILQVGNSSGGSKGTVQVVNTNLQIMTLGNGLQIKTGSNAKVGSAVLVGGTVTVSNTSVTANSLILITGQLDGGVVGFHRVNNIVANTSFDIVSSNIADTSTVAYMIVEKIP
jgi:hypothetical protein